MTECNATTRQTEVDPCLFDFINKYLGKYTVEKDGRKCFDFTKMTEYFHFISEDKLVSGDQKMVYLKKFNRDGVNFMIIDNQCSGRDDEWYLLQNWSSFMTVPE